MNKTIRIGTRDSQLATWQAMRVKQYLESIGARCELVYIKSDGDLDLVTPIYEMGVQGVFTKQLDTALLNNQIDLAVHSMKDIPTALAQGIVTAAVLPRDNYKDVLVMKVPLQPADITAVGFVIATGSIRRRAQWLSRYPKHTMENLRGNINTRLRKLDESNWNGAIFAAAGLERLQINRDHQIELDWMLPAPAQGIIGITCLKEAVDIQSLCTQINDADTQLCAQIERDFLRTLMGGCSSPIAALAEIEGDQLCFRGRILSLDGSDSREIQRTVPAAEADGLGVVMANILLQSGADKIIERIRNA